LMFQNAALLPPTLALSAADVAGSRARLDALLRDN
jgi:hypothetical protein